MHSEEPHEQQRRLPRGRVEAVMIVDPERRPMASTPDGKWRFSFDWKAFATEDGGQVREARLVARVSHCLTTIAKMLQEFRDRQVMPVYMRKEEGDEFTVVLWKSLKNPQNDRVLVRGFPVSIIEIEQREQCAWGFDEGMAFISRPEEFAP
jgi:hypothetical protein